MSKKFLLTFFPFLQNGSKEDNKAHRFSQMGFLNKFLMLDYRGLSVQNGCFFTFLSFSTNGSKDLSNFLQGGRGQ